MSLLLITLSIRCYSSTISNALASSKPNTSRLAASINCTPCSPSRASLNVHAAGGVPDSGDAAEDDGGDGVPAAVGGGEAATGDGVPAEAGGGGVAATAGLVPVAAGGIPVGPSGGGT